MEYFIFNGVSSNDMGIIIKEMPPVIKSEKNVETVTISGRNGDLHIDDGTYKTKKYKIKCILTDTTKIENLKKLCDGTGSLELSTELGKEYQATIYNQIDFSKYLTYLKEFTLQFELYPISYSKELKEIICDSNTEFSIGGTVDVSPIITINGTGVITLNNTQVKVAETGIIIDCELMNCTKDNINKNDKVNLDNFPQLLVGDNTLVLGEGIESVIINYKEGWL